MDLESSHHMLVSTENLDPEDEQHVDPDVANYQNTLSRALSEGQLNDNKILAFKQKAPQVSEGSSSTIQCFLMSSYLTYNGIHTG